MKKQLSQNEIDKLIQRDIERIINKLEFDKINSANRYSKFNKIACIYIEMRKHVELLEKYPDVKKRLVSQKFGIFNKLVYGILKRKDIFKYDERYKNTPYHQELKHLKRVITYLIDKHGFCQSFEKLIKRNEIQQAETYFQPDIVEEPEIANVVNDVFNQEFVDDLGDMYLNKAQEPEEAEPEETETDTEMQVEMEIEEYIEIETDLEEPEELTMEDVTESETDVINLFNQE